MGVVRTSLGLKGSPNDAVGRASTVIRRPTTVTSRPNTVNPKAQGCIPIIVPKDFPSAGLSDFGSDDSRRWRMSFGGLGFMSLGTGA